MNYEMCAFKNLFQVVYDNFKSTVSVDPDERYGQCDVASA